MSRSDNIFYCVFDKVKGILLCVLICKKVMIFYAALIIRIPVPILRQYGLILLAFLFVDAFAFNFAS